MDNLIDSEDHISNKTFDNTDILLKDFKIDDSKVFTNPQERIEFTPKRDMGLPISEDVTMI